MSHQVTAFFGYLNLRIIHKQEKERYISASGHTLHKYIAKMK